MTKKNASNQKDDHQSIYLNALTNNANVNNFIYYYCGLNYMNNVFDLWHFLIGIQNLN